MITTNNHQSSLLIINPKYHHHHRARLKFPSSKFIFIWFLFLLIILSPPSSSLSTVDYQNAHTPVHNQSLLPTSSSSTTTTILSNDVITITTNFNYTTDFQPSDDDYGGFMVGEIEQPIPVADQEDKKDELMDLMLPRSLRIIATIVCLLVLVLGVLGNILVPVVVCRQRETLCNNSTNVFLINLSIADLLVLVVCMPTVFIELHSKPEVWMLGEFMCKTVPFLELVVAHGSILTILAISFERYYAICKPLKANYKCTNRRAVMTICCLWSIAMMATVPVLFGTELVQATYIDGSIVSVCITKANATWQRLYFLVSIVGFFCLPLFILIVVYLIITRRLTNDDRRLLIASIHSSFTSNTSTGTGTLSANGPSIAQSNTCKQLRSGSLPVVPMTIGTSGQTSSSSTSIWNPANALFLFRSSVGSRCGSACSTTGPAMSQQPLTTHHQQQRRNSSVIAAASVARSRRQVIFMLAAVVLSFFLCHLPFRLFTLWLLLVTDDEIRALSMERFYNLLYFCRVMIYVNSMLNPLLYAVVSSKFRLAAMDTLFQSFSCCYYYCYYCCWCCYGEYNDSGSFQQESFDHNQNIHHPLPCTTLNMAEQSTTTNSSTSLITNFMNRHRECSTFAAFRLPGTGPTPGILNRSGRKPPAPLRRRRRRRKQLLMLMRQSTTLTTATTTTTASTNSTSSSMKMFNSSSIRSNNQYSGPSSIRKSKFTLKSPLRQTTVPQMQQQNSFDSSQISIHTNSIEEQNDVTMEINKKNDTDLPKLNSIYSKQHTAEYRRKMMMKRSSRVAIIDNDNGDDYSTPSMDNLDFNQQTGPPSNHHFTNHLMSHPPSIQKKKDSIEEEVEEVDDGLVKDGEGPLSSSSSQTSTPSSIDSLSSSSSSSSSTSSMQNIEELLNDPKFSVYESYV